MKAVQTIQAKEHLAKLRFRHCNFAASEAANFLLNPIYCGCIIFKLLFSKLNEKKVTVDTFGITYIHTDTHTFISTQITERLRASRLPVWVVVALLAWCTVGNKT